MVRAAHHEDAVVALEAVDLVQEVASDRVVDERVQVLEHQVTGGKLAGFAENLFD